MNEYKLDGNKINHEIKEALSDTDVEKIGVFNVKLILFMNNFINTFSEAAVWKCSSK